MPAARPLSATRFQAFDTLATLVAVLDARGQVLYANTALEDALGQSRRSLEGQSLLPRFDDAATLAHALQGLQGDAFAALRFDACLHCPGRPPVPVHAVVTRAEQPRQAAVVELLPLTAQAQQEREERLAEQARANKELFRNLAHEIKNPLGGIRGAAQLLEMDIGTPALREYTQVIIRECDRLQSLVDRLLAPHRQPQRLEPLNIHEVLERVRALILAEFPQGLSVERDYDTSIPEFLGDREQLIQAVLNIAHNAAQALAPRMADGSARISLQTRVLRQATFGGQRYKLALQLRVTDNGPGVPDALKSRVFAPLVSGREGGTGLGLTLAQTYVQQHQGLIELHSQPGHTDFRILIPLR